MQQGKGKARGELPSSQLAASKGRAGKGASPRLALRVSSAAARSRRSRGLEQRKRSGPDRCSAWPQRASLETRRRSAERGQGVAPDFGAARAPQSDGEAEGGMRSDGATSRLPPGEELLRDVCGGRGAFGLENG